MSCIRGERSAYISEAEVARLLSLGIPVRSVPSGHFVHLEALQLLLELLAPRS